MQEKEFQSKIFLHENINDFKKYFHAKSKNQNGSIQRKVLSTPEDFVALKFKQAQKKKQM